MTLRTVNLDTYNLSLLTAKEDIINPRSSTNWALFAYDGITNKLKLADSGVGGVSELAGKFHIAKPQYGLCRLGSCDAAPPRIAMICWVGPNVDEYRRTECASHIPAIKSFFKEANVFIGAEKAEDVTEEKIRAELSKIQARGPPEWSRRTSRSVEKEECVGTNYRKTNAAMEMRRINRESFWARAEREEEERKEDERRRAVEERRRLEKERVLKERRETEERDRKMNEKLQRIEEERRKQAELEEELQRQERSKWEQQKREHAEEMRARLKRSESIEKAAEAAVLVSQRSMNPREFFRQLSSSSQSPSSPGSPSAGKPPFRRYKRSLTDTAFVFSKSDIPTPTSPLSPTLVSPFSRAPPSPFRHTTSPPPSPNFRPITSPQRSRAPAMSPPMSPPNRPGLQPTAPPSEAPVQALSPVMTQSSAPPASPSVLGSLSPSLPQEISPAPKPETLPPSPPVTPPQSLAQAQILPPSPPDTPPQTELCPSAICSEPTPLPKVPAVPLPVSPRESQSIDSDTTPLMQTELVSEAAYTVRAVLVEAEEEEGEEGEEEKAKEERMEEKEVEKANNQPDPDMVELTQTVEEGKEDGTDQEAEPESSPELVEVVQTESETAEDGQPECQGEVSHTPAEPHNDQLPDGDEVPAVADAEGVPQQIMKEVTNGIGTAEDVGKQNGLGMSSSSSDADPSSPERVECRDLHGGRDEDYNNYVINENGQEALPEGQLCVRALYDYQAEDESEISFEPGDIISDVETVDKAWWRGYSKDGRQGLFPANYVETI